MDKTWPWSIAPWADDKEQVVATFVTPPPMLWSAHKKIRSRPRPVDAGPGGLPMTTADVAAGPLSDLDHRAQLRRAVIASTVGTTIEWYDFLLYGQMAALVFAKLYFPSSDPFTGTLQAFAVFAVGFVARPIGAAIFGHYGDRIGRKAALIATLLRPACRPFWSEACRPMSRSASGARS
jgi:hypothetical protein